MIQTFIGARCRALLQDDRFGSVIFGIIQTDPKTCQLKFPAIIAAVAQLKPKKPVIFAGLDEGAEVPAQYIAQLRALGVPYFPSPERALRAVARLAATINVHRSPIGRDRAQRLASALRGHSRISRQGVTEAAGNSVSRRTAGAHPRRGSARG